MSMQLDGIESPTFASLTRSKDIKSRKKDKKRKRTEEHSVSTSPTKKHRSSEITHDSIPIEETQQELDIAEETLQAKDTVEASPFFEQTSSLYLPLSPICQQYPLQGICAEHLSLLILNYYPPLDGVVLSYSNPKLSSTPPESSDDDRDEEEGPVLAQCVDEYAASFVWVTVEFLVFRPRRGCRIEGWINLQNEGNIGLVCYNFFSASIERKRLPKEWKWIRGGTGRFGARKSKQSAIQGEEEETLQSPRFGDEDGYFVTGDGKRVEGALTFKVKDMEASRISDREPTFVSIEGTLLSDAEEKELRQQDFIRSQARSSRRLGVGKGTDHTMTGALPNGHVDSGSDIERTPKLKHRIAY